MKDTLLKVCLCLLLSFCLQDLLAQTDSVPAKPAPLPQPTDTLRKLELSPEQTAELQSAVSNPVWFLLTQIAPVFNIGIYYSYLTPLGTFNTQVPAASAFSFDIGLDLNRITGYEDADIHWFIGMNADFTNFGKVNAPTPLVMGDTTYTTVLKNSLEVTSWYLEAGYRRSFLCPFASVAYSTIYLNPYREVKMHIRNPTTNLSETKGDYAGTNISHGINMALGLKCKYRFNDHKELMVLAKASYLMGSSTNMIDLSTASVTSSGLVNYQTINVNPMWLMYSVGIKYNF
ncbi:MAG: hypothetical protein V4590_14095 [Bacteroidota bacterium]